MQSTDTKVIDTVLKSVAKKEALSILISGSCMSPLIKDGAMVQIRRKRVYLPGDILVKRDSLGQLVAHRLVGFYPRKGHLYYVTRADNAATEDAAINSTQIIGRISGGQCEKPAISIPIADRTKAMRHFSSFMVKRLYRKVLRSEK
jgi:hypothetical protein